MTITHVIFAGKPVWDVLSTRVCHQRTTQKKKSPDFLSISVKACKPYHVNLKPILNETSHVILLFTKQNAICLVYWMN